jgi:hypothetical protein
MGGIARVNKVDLFMLVVGIKPAVRFLLKTSSSQFLLKQKFCFLNVQKSQGAAYISKSKRYTEKLILSDNSSICHEKKFGKLLGYPICCCTKVKLIFENNIDAYENVFLKSCSKGTLLDTRLYRQGIALISHVPCNAQCLHSIRMAEKTLFFLNNTKGPESFELWKKKVLNYFGDKQTR